MTAERAVLKPPLLQVQQARQQAAHQVGHRLRRPGRLRQRAPCRTSSPGSPYRSRRQLSAVARTPPAGYRQPGRRLSTVGDPGGQFRRRHEYNGAAAGAARTGITECRRLATAASHQCLRPAQPTAPAARAPNAQLLTFSQCACALDLAAKLALGTRISSPMALAMAQPAAVGRAGR